jgi:hypothetical protein
MSKKLNGDSVAGGIKACAFVISEAKVIAINKLFKSRG